MAEVTLAAAIPIHTSGELPDGRFHRAARSSLTGDESRRRSPRTTSSGKTDRAQHLPERSTPRRAPTSVRHLQPACGRTRRHRRACASSADLPFAIEGRVLRTPKGIENVTTGVDVPLDVRSPTTACTTDRRPARRRPRPQAVRRDRSRRRGQAHRARRRDRQRTRLRRRPRRDLRCQRRCDGVGQPIERGVSHAGPTRVATARGRGRGTG